MGTAGGGGIRPDKLAGAGGFDSLTQPMKKPKLLYGIPDDPQNRAELQRKRDAYRRFGEAAKNATGHKHMTIEALKRMRKHASGCCEDCGGYSPLTWICKACYDRRHPPAIEFQDRMPSPCRFQCDFCYKVFVIAELVDVKRDDGHPLRACPGCLTAYRKRKGDCCEAWTKSAERGTDNEHYGALRWNAGAGWLLGNMELGEVKFCPWCGAKK